MFKQFDDLIDFMEQYHTALEYDQELFTWRGTPYTAEDAERILDDYISKDSDLRRESIPTGIATASQRDAGRALVFCAILTGVLLFWAAVYVILSHLAGR